MKINSKAVLMVLFLVLTIKLFGQEVIITKKDGSLIKGKVVGTSSNSIFTNNGTVLHNEVSKVGIISSGPASDSFAAYLSKAGIIMEDANQLSESGEIKGDVNQMILNQQGSDFTIKELNVAIEAFRVERQIGKGMQILGLLAGTAGSLLLAEGGKGVQEIVIAGGVISTVGFVIDFGAGRHLKRKK